MNVVKLHNRARDPTESMYIPSVQDDMPPKPAKQRKRGGSDHRKRIWSWLFGTDKKAPCPLCGECEIYSGENTTSPFEAAHIVAHAFSKDEEAERSMGEQVFYIVPCCSSCNDATGTQTIWDFLYVSSRLYLLKDLAWKWFVAYSNNFPATVEASQGILWRLVDHLFGPTRYPNGGGIKYTNQIYYTLYMLQLHKLQEKHIELLKVVVDTHKLSETVLKSLKFQ
jgi:hypothetical protein